MGQHFGSNLPYWTHWIPELYWVFQNSNTEVAGEVNHKRSEEAKSPCLLFLHYSAHQVRLWHQCTRLSGEQVWWGRKPEKFQVGSPTQHARCGTQRMLSFLCVRSLKIELIDRVQLRLTELRQTGTSRRMTRSIRIKIFLPLKTSLCLSPTKQLPLAQSVHLWMFESHLLEKHWMNWPDY